MEVSVRELKIHLSKYLRRVAAGHELVITSHKRPVARLVPARAALIERTEDVRERLKRVAGMRIGRGGKPKGVQKPVKMPEGVSLADIVLESRR